MSQITDIATMNAVVREEIQRQQARMRAKAELDRTVRDDRERLLAARIAELNKKYSRKPNLFKRLWGRVDNAWCMAWAVWLNAPEIFVNWCVAVGLAERVEEL